MPAFMNLCDGKKHDDWAAQQIYFPADSILEGDRAYLDFNWMLEMDEVCVFSLSAEKRTSGFIWRNAN
jgi:hypothetical protein